jgi:hypothetical protein
MSIVNIFILHPYTEGFLSTANFVNGTENTDMHDTCTLPSQSVSYIKNNAYWKRLKHMGGNQRYEKSF